MEKEPNPEPSYLFPLGRTLATPGIMSLTETGWLDPADLFSRHQTGDWGDVDEDDWKANDAALLDGGRIFSSYAITDQQRVWVITDESRASTTVLLPDEY